MSVRIVLDNAPEFYTNLDPIVGRVIVNLQRTEQIGTIVVKLEGEAKTALVPQVDPHTGNPTGGPVATESHKILYRIQQVFPDENNISNSFVLRPGTHQFPFRFKIPFNNVCSDIVTMSKMGGLGGVGGFGAGGGGLFGSGIRVMDGTSQIFLHHVKKTLPPSLTGFPGKAEIRYYIKATVQRPGILKENWRTHIGFRFMPIEEPRPPKSQAKAFAKRPFAFRPLSPAVQESRRYSFFGKQKVEGPKSNNNHALLPPSVEVCAWLPHPCILTCNSPIPLEIDVTKKMPSTQAVFLIAVQIELIGTTRIRCYDMVETIVNRFVVVSNPNLHIPLTRTPDDEVGTKIQVPNDIWRNIPLPNTVCPSFTACNLSRTYSLDVKLGLSWEAPGPKGMFSNNGNLTPPQAIYLPLHFSDVKVYSGIAPPPEVLSALQNRPPGKLSTQTRPPAQAPAATLADQERPPQLPPRINSGPMVPPFHQQQQVAASGQAAPPYDPLYPPQLGQPGAPPYDDAPPSYDEAMAAEATGPVERPAFSGVTTDVNGPSQIPDKRR